VLYTTRIFPALVRKLTVFLDGHNLITGPELSPIKKTFRSMETTAADLGTTRTDGSRCFGELALGTMTQFLPMMGLSICRKMAFLSGEDR